MTKTDVSILLGNVLDRFDTSLFSFLAPVVGPLFFPQHDPIVQLILIYSTNITAFISRPCGTLFFGMLAQKRGPLFSLSYSLMGVALLTMCIGCIPTYETIGWYAPVLLVGIRLLRGMCAAGEGSVAKMYIMENKTDEHALRASYWYQTSSVMGIIFASAVATGIISTYPLLLWRYAFLVGGVTGIMGYFMRVNANRETAKLFSSARPEYQPLVGVSKDSAIQTVCAYPSINSPAANTQGERCIQPTYRSILRVFTALVLSANPWLVYRRIAMSGVLKTVRENIASILCIAIATCVSYATYSIPFVFLNTFVPLITPSITIKTMMTLNTALLVCDMIMIPGLGHLLLRYDAKKIMLTACLVLATSAMPLFYFLPGASLIYVTFVRIWIVMWGVIFLCPLNFWSKSLFKPQDQYVLVGIAHTLGAATLGHMTTPLCLWLWYATGIVWIPGAYLSLLLFITGYAIYFLPSPDYFLHSKTTV